MKDKESEQNKKSEKELSAEEKKHMDLLNHKDDMTDLLFDLFFDKEFKGNTVIKKDNQEEE